jgi:hypothetical protein
VPKAGGPHYVYKPPSDFLEKKRYWELFYIVYSGWGTKNADKSIHFYDFWGKIVNFFNGGGEMALLQLGLGVFCVGFGGSVFVFGVFCLWQVFSA